jgi:uncharacterized protein (DUF952 family)
MDSFTLRVRHARSLSCCVSATKDCDLFCTLPDDANSLLPIANHFYRTDTGTWIVLEIDKAALGDAVVYEAPAPVGNIKAHVDVDAADADAVVVKFPHIYSGLPEAAVLRTFDMIRAADGTFEGIAGL